MAEEVAWLNQMTPTQRASALAEKPARQRLRLAWAAGLSESMAADFEPFIVDDLRAELAAGQELFEAEFLVDGPRREDIWARAAMHARREPDEIASLVLYLLTVDENGELPDWCQRDS